MFLSWSVAHESKMLNTKINDRISDDRFTEPTQNPVKVYSQSAIAIATLFGGPFASAWLIAKNFQAFQRPSPARMSLWIGVIISLLIIIFIFFTPEAILSKIPNTILPFIYSAAAYVVVERTQGDELQSHKMSGGSFYSRWRAVGIGAIIMVLFILVIGLVAFINGDFAAEEDAGFDTATYDRNLAIFIENDQRALAIFEATGTATNREMVKGLSEGIGIWYDNTHLVNNMMAIENLPQEFVVQNNIMMKYCELRIKQYNLLIKRIAENSNRWDEELIRLGQEIEGVLKQLS